MAEIFRKLKALDFQWKIITPYFIRCKCVHVREQGVIVNCSPGQEEWVVVVVA